MDTEMTATNKWKGFNAFQIKVIALILMTFDHVHYLFSQITGVPQWFTMLGRIAAPLFIFMIANGMRYTRNRTKYMLRLYIGSIFMNVMNFVANKYFPHPAGAMMIANIFSTLFLIALYIVCIDGVKEGYRERNVIKIIKFILISLIPILTSILTIYFTATGNNMLVILVFYSSKVFPSLSFTEGGFIFVLLGVGFYLCGESKKRQAVFYLVLCAAMVTMTLIQAQFNIAILGVEIQWFMIFALPFILLYNGKRGRGMKYLFYLYYPAHIYALLFLARLIAGV